MVRAESLTPEPVGLGTRSRAELRSRGRTVEVTAEITAYERPSLLGSKHRSALPSSRSALDTSGTLTFEPVDEGTRMRWAWELEPRGAYRLLGPLIGLLGAHLERRIWTG
jgi:Polyketide cyclase / dehydrase and lipid transport